MGSGKKSLDKSQRSNLRVIGGSWRRSLIRVPPQTRPTLTRHRETLFNWLQNQVPGGRILDLFSGSGALGIEALSRGAAHVDFVDVRTAKWIETSIQSLTAKAPISGTWCVHDCSAETYLEQCADRYHLICLDPPYDLPPSESLLMRAVSLLLPESHLFVETEIGKVTYPSCLVIARESSGKLTQCHLLKKSSNP